MKRAWIITLGVLTLSLVALGIAILVGAGAMAKRGPRPDVPPVEIAGTEYRAPNTVETEGCIEAWDVKARTLLWRKKVYHRTPNSAVPLRLFHHDTGYPALKRPG